MSANDNAFCAMPIPNSKRGDYARSLEERIRQLEDCVYRLKEAGDILEYAVGCGCGGGHRVCDPCREAHQKWTAAKEAKS